jgi:hypothetical protein
MILYTYKHSCKTFFGQSRKELKSGLLSIIWSDISLRCMQTVGRAVMCRVQAVSLVAINLSSWP